MQVKKFEAKSVQEALQVIKRELGPEAIILSTRHLKRAFGLLNGPSVEVTAAISDHSLLKKRLAETKMKDDLKEKVNKSKGSAQASVYDRFAKKIAPVTPAAEEKKEFPRQSKERTLRILSKRYVDILDTDQDADLAKASTTVLGHTAKTANPAEKTPLLPGVTKASQASPTSTTSSPNLFLAQVEHVHDTSFGEMGVLREQLLWVGVHADVASQIVRVIHNDNELWRNLRGVDVNTQMKNLIPVLLNYIRMGRPVEEMQRDGKRVFALIGATGVGKTTTIAKLAVQLEKRAHLKVGLLSTDVFRMGGLEHLAGYAGVLGCPFKSVSTPEELPTAVGELLSQTDVILMDTPGTSVVDLERLSFVQKCLQALPQTHTFLVSAVNQTSPARLAREAGGRFGGISFDGHIFTKVDETDTRGEIINQAYLSKRPVHYITTGQRVPQDLEHVSREVLEKIVFHHVTR